MKTFLTKKNLAIVLAVLLVVVIVVLCITMRQKSVADTDPTLTLTSQSADADGACTVDVVLSGLPDGNRIQRLCHQPGNVVEANAILQKQSNRRLVGAVEDGAGRTAGGDRLIG